MSKQDAGKDVKPFQSLGHRTHVGLFHFNTRVGTLIVATIYLQPVASDVEVVGYL